MGRIDGFAVMDVSTDIANDPKFRKLQRVAPDHAATAFTAYVALAAGSWKAGRRVTVDDSWPSFLTYSLAAIQALQHVELIDETGCVLLKTWRAWYEPARRRRDAARRRWAKANRKRSADTPQ